MLEYKLLMQQGLLKSRSLCRPEAKFDQIRAANLTLKREWSPPTLCIRLCTELHAGPYIEHGGAAIKIPSSLTLSWSHRFHLIVVAIAQRSIGIVLGQARFIWDTLGLTRNAEIDKRIQMKGRPPDFSRESQDTWNEPKKEQWIL